MSINNMFTPNDNPLSMGNSDKVRKETTGTDVGSKRGIDVSVIAGGSAASVYAIRTDESSTANTLYAGFADAGTATSAASWRVFRMVDTSGDLVIQYADGNTSFDNVWDNRVSLSYS